MEAKENIKLVQISVFNVQIIRFYAEKKFNVMKKLFAIIAALVLLAFVYDAQAQKEEKKVVKKVIVNKDGRVTETTDTFEIDVDMDVEDHKGFHIIKLNGDSIMTLHGKGGEKMVWVDHGNEHKQIRIKRMHHGDSEDIDLMIEQIIGEKEDSLIKELKVMVHKLPCDGQQIKMADDVWSIPPPPPPAPRFQVKKFKQNIDPLQLLLDDPEYEIVKFEKKVKKGVETLEIQRKKK